MNPKDLNPGQQKQLKFAEAGILFVLILGMTIFLGVRLTARDEKAVQNPVAEVAEQNAPVVAEVTEATPPVVAGDTTVVEASGPAARSTEPRIVTYGEAEAAYLAGDYAEATALFTDYVQDHSANAWGQYMLGLAAWKAGELDTADAALQAALELQPDHLKSLINHGRVLLDLQQPEAALGRLEAAAALAPDNVVVHRVLARVQHNLGQLDQATASYRTALAGDPDDVWSLNNLGLILIQRERFAEALPPLARASQLAAEDARIQNNLGIALERTGHLQAAVAAYEQALAADGRHAKAAVSLERVTALAEDQPGEPVDLAALAASFPAENPVTLAVAAMGAEVATEEDPAPQPAGDKDE